MKLCDITKSLYRLYGLLLSNVFCYRKTMAILYNTTLRTIRKTLVYFVNAAPNPTRAAVNNNGWDKKRYNPHNLLNHNYF